MPPAPDVIDVLASIALSLGSLDHDEATGTVEDRALQLATIDRIIANLRELREGLVDSLVADLPEDKLQTPHGWLVRERLADSVSWDNERVRRDVRQAIIVKVATDPETGAQNAQRRQAIIDALDWYEQTFSVGAPKAALRTVWKMDADEYRASTPRGHIVKLVDPMSLKP